MDLLQLEKFHFYKRQWHQKQRHKFMFRLKLLNCSNKNNYILTLFLAIWTVSEAFNVCQLTKYVFKSTTEKIAQRVCYHVVITNKKAFSKIGSKNILVLAPKLLFFVLLADKTNTRLCSAVSSVNN